MNCDKNYTQNEYAPIVLFVYNRPWHTKRTLDTLSKNHLADKSNLIIFADGPIPDASPDQLNAIFEVRTLIRAKKWCKNVEIIEKDHNIGLANSIITGVTEILNIYEKIIVLEDDLITSFGFLKYMNNALNLYQDNPKVFHISGYMFPVNKNLPETFFLRNTSCWGWGTWKRAWFFFISDSNILYKKITGNKKNEIKFNLNNSYNYSGILRENMLKKIDSWAIRWYASTFLQNGLCLHPRISLVRNIGFDNSGTNCNYSNISNIYLQQKIIDQINISNIEIAESKIGIKSLYKFYNQQNYPITFTNYLFYNFKNNKIMILKKLYAKITHYLKVLFLKDYRYFTKINKIPRYTEFTTTLFGKKIKSSDSASFVFTYNELLIKQIYKFSTEKKSPYIIDCGANIGLSIIYFKQLYPLAKIIAFEPDKKIFDILTHNIHSFCLKDVNLYNNAVWSETTTLNFQNEGADGGRISNLGQNTTDNTLISAVRLKDFLSKEHIDFLKIDIEGAETEVLKDCENELKQVERIFVEYHSFENKKQSLHIILNILNNAGFRIHALPVNSSEHPFIKRNSYLGIDMQFNIFGFRD